MVGRVAGMLGTLVRWLLVLLRLVPGLAGVLLVSYGAYAVYRPAGFIVLGGFLLVWDWLRK